MVPLPHHANYLGVRFRPGAFFKIFGIPAGELTDRIVPLVDMGGHVCGSLTESLRSCCPVGDQIRVIECAVFRCLHNEHDEDERLRVALAAIMETAGTLRTTDLARRACMSPRQLRRLFDRYVGLSPKTFCRIVRFQRVLSAFKHRGPGKQLPLALTAGYYDQAHFLHEFQEFAGISPSALFQAPAH